MKREPSREVGSSTPSPSRRRRATSTATPTGAYTEEDTKVGADDIKPIIKSGTKKRKPKKNGDRPGDWTSAKRAIFIEKVLTAGYKALDLDAVAEELGLNKRQLINQLTSGRSGNFRDKCIKHISGEE